MKAFLEAVKIVCNLVILVLNIAAIVLILKDWRSNNDSTSLDKEDAPM